MERKPRKLIRCEGRFKELRDELDTALEIVLADRKHVKESDLKEMWSILKDDTYMFDRGDPYFHSTNDLLRKSPLDNHFSLVPLIESNFTFESGIVSEYASRMYNNTKISEALEAMISKPRDFLGLFQRAAADIHLPDKAGLTGYTVSANYGVGSTLFGGLKGGGIRSDSPFLLEINLPYYNGPNRGAYELVAAVGFWPQDNEMLVSQMQPCKNANFPKGTPFGIATLGTAQYVARQMGFNKVVLYNARGHPIFKEHPSSWDQLSKDFVAQWDGSAKKLGYSGSRRSPTGYEKEIGPGSGTRTIMK